MKGLLYKIIFGTAILLAVVSGSFGQQPKANQLFQYGIGPAFLGGLFKTGIAASDFRKKGSFGIAAPSMVDGELIEINGKLYQTRASGETRLAPDTLQIPFGMACFFQPETSFKVAGKSTRIDLEKRIDSCFKNKNGVYAMRISGLFDNVQTRAFHAVNKEPWPTIAVIQANQQLFNYLNLEGTIFGFRMPAYMGSINSNGFHYHFMSGDLKKGGHVIDYYPQNILVEIALIKNVNVEIPQDENFGRYQTEIATIIK